MNKTRLIWILVIIALATLLVIYLYPKRSSETLRVGFLPQIIPSLPHWVAIEKNYYSEARIDIKEVPNNKSIDLVNFMKNGDLDFLPGVSTTDVFNACIDTLTKPLRPLIISHSSITMAKPFDGLLVPRGSLITTVKDLAGKKIAVYPGNTAEAALKVFLTEQNVDISDCEFFPISPTEHLKLLQLGKVDCSFTYEPTRSDCLKDGKTREIFGSVYAFFNDPCAIGLTIISKDYYESNKETALKLIKIWNKSIDFINNNPGEARKILMKKLRLEEAVANNATWINATRSDQIDKAIIEKTMRTYQKIHVIDSNFQLKPDFFLDD